MIGEAQGVGVVCPPMGIKAKGRGCWDEWDQLRACWVGFLVLFGSVLYKIPGQGDPRVASDPFFWSSILSRLLCLTVRPGISFLNHIFFWNICFK